MKMLYPISTRILLKSRLTHKIGGIVVRLDGDPDVLEMAVDILHVPKVGGSSLMKKEQLVEHVEHLR